jgi:hypothetical protein
MNNSRNSTPHQSLELDVFQNEDIASSFDASDAEAEESAQTWVNAAAEAQAQAEYVEALTSEIGALKDEARRILLRRRQLLNLQQELLRLCPL